MQKKSPVLCGGVPYGRPGGAGGRPPAARRRPVQFAHVAYQIGAGNHLLRHNLLMATQGGLMSLGDGACPPITNPGQLIRQILNECGLRGYQGVLADFEQPPAPDRSAFLEELASALSARRGRLYIPEPYARDVGNAVPVVCTAISGGTFQQRLEEAVQAWGKTGLALDVQRLRMDFLLPSPSGAGVPLSQQDLDALLRQLQPVTFYSRELCARYFTYHREAEYHFVVYDDANTIREKLRLGSRMGAAAAFLMYPEVQDLLDTILK